MIAILRTLLYGIPRAWLLERWCDVFGHPDPEPGEAFTLLARRLSRGELTGYVNVIGPCPRCQRWRESHRESHGKP